MRGSGWCHVLVGGCAMWRTCVTWSIGTRAGPVCSFLSKSPPSPPRCCWYWLIHSTRRSQATFEPFLPKIDTERKASMTLRIFGCRAAATQHC